MFGVTSILFKYVISISEFSGPRSVERSHTWPAWRKVWIPLFYRLRNSSTLMYQRFIIVSTRSRHCLLLSQMNKCTHSNQVSLKIAF